MSEVDQTVFKHSLDALSKPKQVAFMLLLCERMMPGLQKFSSATGYDISCYRRAIGDGWVYLIGGLNAGELFQECLASAPDTEEYDHPLTSAALNAVLSLELLKRFILEGDVDHILEAAGLARDTVAIYVQSIEALSPVSLNCNEVMGHPLIQREIHREVEDIAVLSSLPEGMRRETIDLLKKRARQPPQLIPLDN